MRWRQPRDRDGGRFAQSGAAVLPRSRLPLVQGLPRDPVNPGQAGKEILGQKAVASLGEITEEVDMVDVFREPSACPASSPTMLAMKERPKVLWGQLGVVDEAAAEAARNAGITVIMDRCPAIEWPRLMG